MANNRKPLSDEDRKRWRMAYDILEGMTFDDAATTYGYKSRQAAQKVFRLTVVNLMFPSRKEIIKKKKYNIKYLRDIWRQYDLPEISKKQEGSWKIK